MSLESTEFASKTWRLIVDPPTDGAENMAVDEALLDHYLTTAGIESPPTLRIYGWRRPTLSLGKGQDAAVSHDPAFIKAQRIDLIRRPTGGQAVLHEGERTYAVIGRLDRPPFDCGVVATYRRIARALKAAMSELGVPTTATERAASTRPTGPVCFNEASTHELVHADRKLIGSAQMRRREAFLQHGSIPVFADPQRLGNAIGAPADGARFTGLSDALGSCPTDDQIDRALIVGFERTFGVAFEIAQRSNWEAERAQLLRAWKYLSAEWTYEGRLKRVGYRPSQIT